MSKQSMTDITQATNERKKSNKAYNSLFSNWYQIITLGSNLVNIQSDRTSHVDHTLYMKSNEIQNYVKLSVIKRYEEYHVF